MFVLRKKDSLWVHKGILIVVMIFVLQMLLIIALSAFHPPTRYRTSIKDFFSDVTEYFALSSFIAALIFCHKLLNRVDRLLKEIPPIINWGSTKPKNEIKNLREKLMTGTIDWKTPVGYALITCAVFFFLVKTFGVVESQEPLELTLVWVLDDFIAIAGLISIIYVSYFVSKLIFRISKISINTLNIFHIDRMGGLSVVGNLASYRSLFLGLTLGVWLVPWLLKCIFTPILRERTTLGLATFHVELLIIGAIMLFPFSFFILDAWRIHNYVTEFKEKTVDELAKAYWAFYMKVDGVARYDRKTRHEYVKMQLLDSRIERIDKLKEWPLGSTNIAQIAFTIALPIFELVVKQLISS